MFVRRLWVKGGAGVRDDMQPGMKKRPGLMPRGAGNWPCRFECPAIRGAIRAAGGGDAVYSSGSGTAMSLVSSVMLAPLSREPEADCAVTTPSCGPLTVTAKPSALRSLMAVAADWPT